MTTTEQLEARIRVLENDIAAWHAAARDVMGTPGDVGPNALRRWHIAIRDGASAPPSAGKARVDLEVTVNEVTVNEVNPDRWCADLAAKAAQTRAPAIGRACDVDPPGGASGVWVKAAAIRIAAIEAIDLLRWISGGILLDPSVRNECRAAADKLDEATRIITTATDPPAAASAARRPTIMEAANAFGQACRDARSTGSADVEIRGELGDLANNLRPGDGCLVGVVRERHLQGGSVLKLRWRF